MHRSTRVLVLLAAAQAVPGVALAATLTVESDGSGTYTSIQDAINAAVDGDTVEVGPGTYSEAIVFNGKPITVQSTDGAGSTVIDAGGSDAYAVRFEDYEEATSVLDGFTVRNSGEQGILCDRSNPTLRNLRLSNLGSSSDAGGAMYISSGGPVIDTVTFANNQAAYGGDIFMDDLSAPEISNSSFSNSSALYNGGSVYVDAASYVAVTDSSFSGASATNYGGTFFGEDFAVFELSNVDVSDSATTTSSTTGGGALWVDNYAEVYVATGTWTGNDCGGGASATSGAYGGAFRIGQYGVVELSDMDISGNECRYGGAIYASNYSDLTLTDVTISDNLAQYSAALYLSWSDTTLTRVAVSANEATYFGGAGYLYYGTHLWQDVSVTDNTSLSYAGGLRLTYADVTGDGVTVTGNTVTSGYAGGLYLQYGTLDLTNLTLSNNSATTYGGGMYAYQTASYPISVNTGTINGNQAQEGGALWFSNSDGTNDWTGISADGNSATDMGGFAYVQSGTMALYDSSLTTNTAAEGGALYFDESGQLTISGSSLEDNVSSTGAGGAVYFYGGSTSSSFWIDITDSVFTDNLEPPVRTRRSPPSTLLFRPTGAPSRGQEPRVTAG